MKKILKSGVYIIICNENKVYIGSSNNLKKRRSDHFSALRNNRHKNNYLQFAFNKYKEKNFRWEILEYCEVKKIRERENFYIYKYQSTNSNCGYNLSLRAEKNIPSEKTKEKMRQKMKGRKPSAKTIEGSRKYHTGRKLTKETIAKRTKAVLGSKRSDKTKEIMSKAQRKYNDLVPEWKDLRRKGISYCEMEKIYNIYHGTIKQYLNKFYPEDDILRIKTKQKDLRKYIQLVDEWKNLTSKGFSYKEISEKYNVGKSTVSKYLKKYFPENSEYRYKRQFSEKEKEKLRQKAKGNKYSLGKKCSEENKRKMSEKNKQYRHTEEAKKKISQAGLGRKCSLETRKKISEAKKGRKIPPEICRKQGLANRKYERYVLEWSLLRKQGLFYREIGERYNICEANVRNYLKKYHPELMQEKEGVLING